MTVDKTHEAQPFGTPDADGAACVEPRIVRRIESGPSGVAYDAVDVHTDTPVELIRLIDTGKRREGDQALTLRLRRLALWSHPSKRGVLAVRFDTQPAWVTLESRPEQTLADLLSVESPDAARCLSLLLRLAGTLADAWRYGLSHDRLTAAAVGVEGATPRLNYLALDTGGGLPMSVATPLATRLDDGEARDTAAFAGVVAQMLRVESIDATLRSASPRATAGLSQSVEAWQTGAPEAPTLDELAERVEALLGELRGSVTLADAIEETASPPIDATAVVEDAKQEVGVPVLDADATRDMSDFEEAVATRPLLSGDRLGRFYIERKLGEGGMGAVYKGVDCTSDQVVAIKVLSQAAKLRQNSMKRFHKEARMLASLKNAHIANLIEVNEDRGLHYIVLEFVDGVDLKRVMLDHGAFDEQTALRVVEQVAAALVDAHESQIIHRDIKPENILLVGGAERLTGGSENLRIRLTDFGIARSIDQSESLAMTQAGGMIGTPLYMAPEQFKGNDTVLPQSDVYALGATLFELLTARTPFLGDDPMSLAGKHCLEPAPSVRSVEPRVSEPTANLVARCLAKKPEDRFADAGDLRREVARLLRSDASVAPVRPHLPEHEPGKVIENTHEWLLDASPADLWPHVSNTERLNRAIGLPAVEYTTEVDDELGVRRFARVKLAGFAMSWEEHPYEWVEGRRMSILREFDSGPFKWFVSNVELESRPEGGTHLKHDVRILPRNLMGRLLAHVETGAKCRRSLDSVYRRIDRTTIQAPRNSLADHFEAKHTLPDRLRERLAGRTAELVDRGVDPEVAEQLAAHVAEGPAQEVGRIRPLALARRMGVDPDTMTDVCLHAASVGMLQLGWDILCPTCRVAADSKQTLQEIAKHTHCEACNHDFDSGLASAVEMVFKVSPDLRDTAVGKYCVGGPWHAPHVVAQIRLEPGEKVELGVDLVPGEYLLRGPGLTRSLTFKVREAGGPTLCEVRLDAEMDTSVVPVLRAPSQTLAIENAFAAPQIVRVERTVARDDVITAAQAATLPRFRELFPNEVLEDGKLITAQSVTLMATGIADVAAVYERLGDIEAYEALQSHLRRVEQAIRDHRGDVVKTVGEGVLASFVDPQNAVEAALAIQAEETLREPTQGFCVSIGVYHGESLIANTNGRLDYFGSTARKVLDMPTTCPGVSLSESVHADPLVADLLHDRALESHVESISLLGAPSEPILLIHTRTADDPNAT